ncbi:sulfate ABC transporter substrate-binding protein [Beijerinckia sp. L45]|uniref:sulfate ABC transporter substrate-binding protein n=1 Tax=Beijerinckia sp. L45 TaxID=1641855 RepID=UPI00131EC987|nr:sulfate ABC transporter substrate-binding protein [Beijerinckia sp. L45]
MRKANPWLNGLGVSAAVVGLSLIFLKNLPADPGRQLINVSYDPTRELYAALNPLFAAGYEKDTGRHLTIVQSHGGSSRQARKVISGEQSADVVTLGLYSDVEALQKRGLIASGWEDRLPNHSRPYTSTIVFVVRQGNPRAIKDWPDLIAPGLEVVTPDPRTSSNGKLVALAAWAAVTSRGGSDADALGFLQALFQHTPVLDEGARGAATTFALQGTGNVHLTWENEALREVADSKGKLQVVYPPISILAEPYVAWVDSALSDKPRLQAAQAYLRFLYDDHSQETIARLGYRPFQVGAARRAGVTFPDMKLVPITAVAHDWTAANQKFFSENGVIETILGSRKK